MGISGGPGVRKPDGNVRLCIDYRKLNDITEPDPYYIPLISEIIDKVGEARFLSKIDLAKGFYQVPLSQDAQAKSAFTTLFGKFEFRRMPFGMKNAPATFQRLMDTVLVGQDQHAAPYLDDVLIFSTTWEDHLRHIRRVLTCLEKAGLTVKPGKCSWGQEVLEYLGHTIGQGKGAVPEARVEAIHHYIRPKTQSDMRAFRVR